MINEFWIALYYLAINMGYYMMIGLVFVVFLNIFIKKQWIAKHLGGSDLWACVKASIFGVPLPLCSCGVVPTGLYLKEKGASKASTVSFLISTPQTGADSIIATYGLMGPLFAIYRPMAAFISGVLGGAAVKIFDKKEKNESVSHIIENEKEKTFPTKIKESLRYAFSEFIDDISVHFVIGLIVAALIAVLIPADFLVSIGLGSGILSMLLMIAVGAPMYICSTSSIPIAIILIAKGLSPGAAFVFLFMGPFTNAASIIMISKKFGKRTTFIYFLSAAFSAVGFGLLLDYIVSRFNISIAYITQNQQEINVTVFQTVVAYIFIVLVIFFIIRKIVNKIKKISSKNKILSEETAIYNVEGMTCNNCASGLEAALKRNEKVSNAEVSLEEKRVKIWGTINAQEVKQIVEAHGYSVV